MYNIQASFDGVCQTCNHLRKATKQCTGCNIVRYCSVACQKTDWRDHKLYCSPFMYTDRIGNAFRCDSESKSEHATTLQFSAIDDQSLVMKVDDMRYQVVSINPIHGTYGLKLLSRGHDQVIGLQWVYPCQPLAMGDVVRGTFHRLKNIEAYIPLFHLKDCRTSHRNVTPQLHQDQAEQYLDILYHHHFNRGSHPITAKKFTHPERIHQLREMKQFWENRVSDMTKWVECPLSSMIKLIADEGLDKTTKTLDGLPSCRSVNRC